MGSKVPTRPGPPAQVSATKDSSTHVVCHMYVTDAASPQEQQVTVIGVERLSCAPLVTAFWPVGGGIILQQQG